MAPFTLPDPYPNAIRIAIAVFTATAIGYGIILPSEGTAPEALVLMAQKRSKTVFIKKKLT